MADVGVPTVFEPVVDPEKLSPDQQHQARVLASTIRLEDSQAVVQYGMGPQMKIAAFADTMLSQVRNKDAGAVGEILGDLMMKVQGLDVVSLGQDPGMLGRLFGGLKAQFQRFMTRYETMMSQIDATVATLEKQRMQLLRDVVMLDTLYQKNQDYLGELDVWIAAGQFKLEEVKRTFLPTLEQKAALGSDPMDAQRLQDCHAAIHRFERKLYDMKLSRMIALQTGPQIRLIQSNNQSLVEKIQSSIVTTMPLWKNQIVIAISLFRQKGAMELQRQLNRTTGKLMAANAEALKKGSRELAQSNEQGLVELDTLKKVNADLIGTIEETMRIQADGRAKRLSAEQDLVRMEGELKSRLSPVGARAG